MTKVLSGSSRHVLSYMRQNFAALLQVSVLPLAVFALSLILQVLLMRSFMADLLSLQSGAPFDPSQLDPMFRTQGLLLAAGLPGMLANVWLYVRIVRLYALGEMEWVGLTGVTVKATLWTLVYGIGIYALTMIIYVVAVIALMIPALVLAALSGSTESGMTIAAVIGIVGFAVIVLFILWFSCRLLAGLPAVVLGASPDVMKDMWPLTKGESWGLPLRLLASQLMMLVVLAPFLGYFAWRFFAEIQKQVSVAPDGPLPPAFVLDMAGKAIPFSALIGLLYVPFLWFVALLFAEAFSRFKQRPATR